VGGIVPGVGDDVIISDGATVTIEDNTASLNTLTLGQGGAAVLQFGTSGAITVHVTGDLVINAGSSFISAPSGSSSTIKTHNLVIGGNFTNNGALDFSATAGVNGTTLNASGALITLNGSGNTSFVLGNNSFTNLRNSEVGQAGITLNKTTGSILDFQPAGTFRVESANIEGFLSISSGIFSINGNNAFSNLLFNTTSYSIPVNGGFYLNNPNAEILPQNGSVTNNGTIRISQGIYNVGTDPGNQLQTATNGLLNIEGGLVNISGRLINTAGSTTITGGIINLSTAGHSNSTYASFDMSLSTNLTISGNPGIIFHYPNSGSAGDIKIVNSSGVKSITGGVFQMGNTGSPANSVFIIETQVPLHNFTIYNSSSKASLKNYSLTVNNQLTLNGHLLLNNNNLVLTASSSLTGTFGSTGGMLVTNGSGEVRKTLSSNGIYTFPLGTYHAVTSAAEYSPVTVTFAGTAGVSVINTKHASNTSSTHFLNRHWQVNSSGITSAAYNVTATYLSSDVIGTEANIASAIFDGTAWSKNGIVNAATNEVAFSGITTGIPMSISGVAACTLAGGDINPTNVICFGGSNGSISISGVTGSSNLEYSINGGSTWQASSSFPNLSSGTYNVMARDAVDPDPTCVITINNSFTITEPAAITALISATTNVTCNGGTNGSLTVASTGGISPYTYSWSPSGGTGATASNLSAGSYTVTVTDANGCSTTATSEVSQPATAIVINSISSNTPVCSGSTLNILTSASGGTGSYSYSWSGPNSFTSNQQNPTISNATVSASGTYTVTVTDANNCQATSTTDVTVNPTQPVSVTITSSDADNTICTGESVTFTATPTNGGTSPLYQWKVNALNVGSNSSNNTFTTTTLTNNAVVTVVLTSNATPCATGSPATSNSIQTVVNPIPTSPTAGNSGPECVGGTISLTATSIAGATYTWSGPNGFTSTSQNPTISNAT
ncbi:MAG: hypothetical protein H0U44_07280, partial [Flavisolibacter sp.]|nr:hypothetical protein [Flavisolibacter sp.]